nr:tRNA lysidine(34) synthetase TilS [bacterium]
RAINPRVDHASVRASRMLAREDMELSLWAQRILRIAGWRRTVPAIFRADVFSPEPEVIVNRCAAALYEDLQPAGGHRVVSDHILRLSDCLMGRRDSCPLPGGARAVHREGRILIVPGMDNDAARRIIDPNRTGAWIAGVCEVLLSPVDSLDEALPVISGGSLRIRTRRPGDRWKPDPDGESIPLSEHFRKHRVPPEFRDQLPLVADPESGVRWIARPGIVTEVYIIPAPDRWIKLTCRPRSAIRWRTPSGTDGACFQQE